jgi:hypothetical protein
VVLNKSLAAKAKKAGWRSVKLTVADREFLAQLTDRRPELKKQLALSGAWHPPAKAPALPLVGLTPGSAQPVVLLFNQKSKSKVGSVVVASRDGTLQGGVTLVNIA